jgi:RHS repeat-associated protein
LPLARRAVFVQHSQVRTASRENAPRYVGLASGSLVGEYDGSGSLIEETVWLGDIPVATLRPNSSSGVDIFYVHTDQLNTPRAVTRPSDNMLMWTWYSDPFGTDAANENPAGAGRFVYNLRFPGQVFDGQAGLHDNGFRAYDPAIGRYAMSDLLGLAGGSYSTYSYAGSDPLRFIDPLGLAASCGVPDRCAQLRKQIFKKSALLIRELRKYNPIEDARGGFLTGGGLYTVPGGHYTKIQNLQRGLKNDITEYKRLCSDNGGWPPVPRSVDDAANLDVPAPIITPEPDIELPDNNPSVVAPSGGLLEILELIGALAL